MKSFIILITSLLLFSQLQAQEIEKNNANRLINEIRTYTGIETWCIGPCGCKISEVYSKADTLLKNLPFDNLVTLFNDTSHILKYYSFIYVLDKNDSMAFELLKRCITDSTNVYTHLGCVMSGNFFNKLLIMEYKELLEIKYLYGGRGMMRSHIYYNFPPKNKRLWKRKIKELNTLQKKYNLI